MAKFYILEKDVETLEKDAMLSGSSPYLDQFQKYLSEGKALEVEEIRLPILLEVEQFCYRGRMTDNLYFEQSEGIVVSDKVKSSWSPIINNLQYLTLNIIDPFSNNDEVILAKLQGEEIDHKQKNYENYFIVNVVGLVDGVDHAKSELEYFNPDMEIPEDMPERMKKAILEDQEGDLEIDFVNSLKLDECKVPDDLLIFRLKDCPRLIIVKEELVRSIKEAELSGFVFIPIEEYTEELLDEEEETHEVPSTKPTPEKKELKEQIKPGKNTKSIRGIKIKSIKKG